MFLLKILITAFLFILGWSVGVVFFSLFVRDVTEHPIPIPSRFRKKTRVIKATKQLIKRFNVTPDQLVYKEDKQLKKYFSTKGELHYHVFTPSGEYYVQFVFKGNELIGCRKKEQSTVNVFEHPFTKQTI